jgi:DNA-binding transcriptional LysR family regulator
MSLAGIDLNLLVALDALLDERSVTRAAKRVGLSQSAMSHALARLRAVTGDRLLVRTARGLSATPRARGLQGPVHGALAQLDAALFASRPFDARVVEQAVRVSAIDLAQLVLIPTLSKELAREAPGLDLLIRPYDEEITRALADGDSDLAVGLARRLPHLHQQEILRDRFVCVVRKGHPCLRARLTAARFAALAHALVTPRGLAQGAVDRALKRKKLRRRVVLTAPAFMPAALAVAQSDMVLTVAERVVRTARLPLERGGVGGGPPPPRPRPTRGRRGGPPPLVVTMAWHERRHRDPLHQWLRQRLLEVAVRGD